uniref:Uncharacterized protein n=1 Tax=Erpetoichthys calabaricus TaxID=27687 RepID=A0A8C4X684_ERPCA
MTIKRYRSFILILITGLDLQKVFRPVKMEMKHPSYHLMTDEQLFEPTGQMLQIVPVLPERKPVCDILAVDITFNVPHRERFIVTREPDGTLCKATCVERDWMVQIYFPYKGRQLTAPAVFEEAIRYLTFSFIFVLKIHHLTYENIDQHGNCDLLCSTHHFGRMVWYLGSKIRIDGLIIDMILREYMMQKVHVMHLIVINLQQYNGPGNSHSIPNTITVLALLLSMHLLLLSAVPVKGCHSRSSFSILLSLHHSEYLYHCI